MVHGQSVWRCKNNPCKDKNGLYLSGFQACPSGSFKSN